MRDSACLLQLQAWGLFLKAYSSVTDQLERELLAKCQLPLSWYDVLIQIHTASGARIRLQDLGQSLLLSKSGLSRRIDRMESAGFVRREGCPNDGRGVFAILTAEGQKVLEQAIPVHVKGIHDHFGRHLSTEEAVQLRSLFQRILNAEGSTDTETPCVGSPRE